MKISEARKYAYKFTNMPDDYNGRVYLPSELSNVSRKSDELVLIMLGKIMLNHFLNRRKK